MDEKSIIKKVEYFELHRELQELGYQLEKRTCVKDIQNKIWFLNIGDKYKVEIGLNIPSTGSISTLVAKRWAGCIEEAAELAKNFKYNGYSIFYK